jgi:molecular chaperone HscB
MDNVVDFTSLANSDPQEVRCWLCQKPTSMRALFCHHCGTIQPVRSLDHFARLGLERRIDIDTELMDRQYAALKRTLDPGRFAIRGLGERGHAAKQLQALEDAYQILRDPLKRGRYWLSLHEKEFEAAAEMNPLVAELHLELESAAAVEECDRVAQKAGQALEQGILGLMQALRGQNWQQANATLVELDGIETILATVRDRRTRLSVNPSHENDARNLK